MMQAASRSFATTEDQAVGLLTVLHNSARVRRPISKRISYFHKHLSGTSKYYMVINSFDKFQKMHHGKIKLRLH